jgi:GNAT superfamily N-acetyltransferase
MSELFKMTTIHYKMTEAFLERQAALAAPVYSMIEFQGPKIKSVPEGVDVYLYGSLDGISGMLLFLAPEHLLVLSEDNGLLGKYDFLKLIRQFKPKWIKGNPGAVLQVVQIAKPFATVAQSNEILVMKAEQMPAQPELETQIEYAWPEGLDLKEATSLMQRIEKAFSLHPSSINRLKQRIVQRVADGDQCFVEYKGELIAHGAVEYQTPDAAMLGGIFVDAGLRNHGCGTFVTKALMKRVFDRHLAPMLCVYTENQSALHLYESLGFHTEAKMLEICLDYDRS